MESSLKVYLFGDQTYDVYAKLERLLQVRKNPVLNAFFEQAQDALQDEIGRLHLQLRGQLPRFANIAELLAEQTRNDIHPAFQTVLTCVYQLGEFISQHNDAARSYPSPSSSYLLGLCAGGLPAAAISCARSVSELLPLAVHTVAVSFRLALCCAEMRERIQPDGGNASWSILVVDLSPDKAVRVLDDFTSANRLPITSRPYITAYSRSGVTISGPPSVLDSLKTVPSIAGKRIISLPVYVTSHAGHLFSREDVRSIMETTLHEPWKAYVSRIPCVSCSSGRLVTAGNFETVLETAVEQCLRQPLRWDRINAELPAILLSTPVRRVRLLPIGTKSETTLASALQDFVNSNTLPGEKTPAIEVVELSGAKDDAEKMPFAKSKIAVCGLAGRFPGGDSPEAFWDLLHKGLDTCKEAPANRWDIKTHVDPTGKAKNTSAVPWGCWLDNPEVFDARFFGISPKEAPAIDPAQRLALMAAYEAMEAAGVLPGATPSTQKDRIGVFLGVSSNDWGETNSSQQIGTHSIVGGIRPFISGRMNYVHKFSGPSYAVDTACSSSLAAMHMACNALWMGDLDTAVAGGTNVITNPDGHAALDRGFFLSRTGNCKTFDDGADGYCRGEGIGLVLLKRLDDALKDGDPIQAVILDVKTNHSAESDSITRPHAPTQIKLFNKVLAASGTSPNDISYIEMHGTGTQHGDAAEMTSCLTTFAPDTQRRGKDRPLYLGAAKANIGHGEAVSGITSVAKVILMMRHNMIPPHCGIKTVINHGFPLDLKERNVNIAFKPTPWVRGDKPRKVLLNNFSAPGGNTAMVLEDAPLPPALSTDERTSHIIALSAKCGESLLGNMRSLLKFIDESSTAAAQDASFLPSLSYTTTARRQHHIHRASVTGASVAEVRANLAAAIEARQGYTRPIASPNIVFAFTGQGSQYLGMGKQLMAFSQFRDDIKRFNQIAEVHGFPAFEHLISGNSNEDIEVCPPVVVQLAIVCLEMALARLWTSWGITPDAVVGHSLGEYAALNCAGVLSDADTIYLVGERAKLLQTVCRAGTHGMLAVRLSVAQIQSTLGERDFEVACINGPNDTVLGGPVEQIESLRAELGAKNVKATPVRVQFAFHTSQVDPILTTFGATAKAISFNAPKVPVFSPLLGQIVSEGDVFGADYLVRHCRETVNIHGALTEAHGASNLLHEKSMLIEIGAQPLVSSMAKASIGSQLQTFPSLQRGKDAWPLVTTALSQLYRAGRELNWVEYQLDFKAAARVLLLPAYSWDLKKYWIQYVGDWSLRKGDLPSDSELPAPQPAVAAPEEVSRPRPRLESTTVHKVLKEESDDKTAYILVESNISRPDLLPIVQGHWVNGIPLCTPSVYADIALTVGTYLLDAYQPNWKERIVDVGHMEVERALIARGKGPQHLRASAKVDWVAKTAFFSFFSVDANGKSIIEHSTCKVVFRDDSQLPNLLAKRPENLALMEKVARDVKENKAFRLDMATSFKMVAGLAKFHPEHRSTGEISLNGDTMEATSTANFSTVKQCGGQFHTHPAYIDGFTQIAGFVMNAKGSTDLEQEVYVNRGWDSMQMFKPVSCTARYRVYVKMTRAEGTMYKGDVVINDDEGITVAFKGVALRGIPRKAFNMVLQAADEGREVGGPPTKPARPANAATKPAAASTPTTAPAKAAPAPVAKPQAIIAPVQVPAAQPAPKAPKKPKQKAPRKPKSSSNTKWESALAIILEETGLSGDELRDDSAFVDMGVDSLLSMVINSRFKEELELDVDDESNSLFITYPTIKHFKDLLGVTDDADEEEAEDEEEEEEEEEVPELVQPQSFLAPAPPVQLSSPAAPEAQIQPSPPKKVALPNTTIPEVAKPATQPTTNEAFQSIIQIIAEETGVDSADLKDECALADVGVDSLLSMVIASRIREELDLDVESDNGFFVAYPTIKHIRDLCDELAPAAAPAENNPLLTPDSEPSSRAASAADVLSLPDESPQFSESEPEMIPSKSRSFTPCRPAKSVILQGFPKTAKKTLFLLPDGSGSSSSYVALPRLETDNAIVGLNCPYARDPENMTCHIIDLMQAYVAEIQRRQPHGPYHIGGWSSGGVMAYIAVQLLLQAGEDVQTLLILDSPRPGTMDKLPPHFYDYCKAVGLFGDEEPPPYLLGHFDSTVEVLDDWAPSPLPRTARPLRLAIIWAAESVADGRGKPEFPTHLPHSSTGLAFMTHRRSDFGPSGWEKLIPNVEPVMGKVAANHFSMMKKPAVSQVSKFIDRVLG